jgi:hypothetical protein
MKAGKKNHGSRRFENLESRTMLTANVTSSYNNGFLTLTGDNKGDQFIVHQLKNGDWEVDGLNGTKINGQKIATFSDVFSIDIETGSGKDAVGVASGYLPGCLTINTGSGDDLVALAALKVVGSASVCTGSGNDALIVAGLEVCGRSAQTPEISPSTVTSGSLGSACFDMGSGTNIAVLASIKAQNLSLTGGSGLDYFGLIGVCVDECLSVDTGKGTDILGVAASSASYASFTGGNQAGDVMFTAKNSFGGSNSDFKTTIKIDSALKALTSEFKTIQKLAVSTMSGFGSFPVFNV